MTVPDVQLTLDLAGSHHDATTAFKEWLLSLPPTPWAYPVRRADTTGENDG
jgi:hypothetical protein